MKNGELCRSGDFKGEKHVPVISTPEAVTAGVPFDVTVAVGTEIPHPNTTEHFIAWLDLYFKPLGEAFAYHAGHSDFRAHGESTRGANEGPIRAHPKATFSVEISKPGTLVAVSMCNIHGLWESSVDLDLS
ncbi:MAG: class II SORL domain-containing protein [Acidobacteria bacterium]|nr:class II SORL domain-containing protein [Acidobacteriota bacterium]